MDGPKGQRDHEVDAEPADAIERHGYLFGSPITHSYAPLLHNTIFRQLGMPWAFSPLESTDMADVLNQLKAEGLFGGAGYTCHETHTGADEAH